MDLGVGVDEKSMLDEIWMDLDTVASATSRDSNIRIIHVSLCTPGRS